MGLIIYNTFTAEVISNPGCPWCLSFQCDLSLMPVADRDTRPWV